MAEPRVVHRPEPPQDDEPKPKLSREEVQALLAVTQATSKKPGAWSRTARRGGIALLPTAIVSTVLDALVGWWSIPIVIALALAWAALPLIRQRRDGWT
jgi:hypothetical protein